MDLKESIARTKNEFEKSFAQGSYYNKQTRDDKHLQRILSNLDITSSDRVLDLGTGSGYLAFPIASFNPGSQVIGLDILEETLERNRMQAQEQGISNLEFISYDGMRLPFEDKFFDVVVSRYALHHFPNITDTFQEISRILRKGGRLFISDPTPNDEDLDRFIDKFMQMKPDAHVRFYTKNEFSQMCKVNSLEEVQSFITEIRFPRKGADQYKELLKEYSRDIIDGYQVEIMGDEIFISEKVLNMLFVRR